MVERDLGSEVAKGVMRMFPGARAHHVIFDGANTAVAVCEDRLDALATKVVHEEGYSWRGPYRVRELSAGDEYKYRPVGVHNKTKTYTHHLTDQDLLSRA